MTAEQPRLTAEEAGALAHGYFGLTGTLAPLTSERDQNFRLTTPQGQTYVLKIANAAEPAEVTNFQTEALAHVARTAPDLPVPRAVAARDGRVEIALRSGSIVRILTWVEGTPPHLAPRSAALRRSAGRMAARLPRALEGFRHLAEDHELIWAISNAGKLRRFLPSSPEMRQRAASDAALGRFDDDVAVH